MSQPLLEERDGEEEERATGSKQASRFAKGGMQALTKGRSVQWAVQALTKGRSVQWGLIEATWK